MYIRRLIFSYDFPNVLSEPMQFLRMYTTSQKYLTFFISLSKAVIFLMKQIKQHNFFIYYTK